MCGSGSVGIPNTDTDPDPRHCFSQQCSCSDSSEVNTPNQEEEEYSDIEAREDISDYEKMRLRNIRERETMFHELHLDQLKTRLSESFAHKVSWYVREREIMFHELHLDQLKTRLSESFAHKVSSAVLWIRIQIGSIFRNFVNLYSEYGSGSTQVKIG